MEIKRFALSANGPKTRWPLIQLLRRCYITKKLRFDVLYRAIINEFFVPEVEDIDVDGLWSQQDGAACHTCTETINFFEGNFW